MKYPTLDTFDPSVDATKLKTEDSIKYFNSRPRKSKIAAWASKQSSKLEDSKDLIQKLFKQQQEDGKKQPKNAKMRTGRANWGCGRLRRATSCVFGIVLNHFGIVLSHC